MSRQGISTGTAPNDGTGDTLSVGAKKVNENFQEIYDALGDGTDLLTGNPNLTVGFITATGAYFNGDVGIAGTLTYEDVTNIDSVGLITARSGIDIGDPDGAGIGVSFSSRGHGYVGLLTVYDEFQVGPNLVGNGVTITSTGVNVTGIVTATTFEGSGASLTNYPYSSLTGITTDILGDTSPQLGGDLDLNGSDITGTGDINITGTLNVSGVSTLGITTLTDVTLQQLNVSGVSTLGIATITSSGVNVTGIVTANYFQSTLGISTNSGTTTAQINVDSTGSQLIITVPGVGSTTLPLT